MSRAPTHGRLVARGTPVREPAAAHAGGVGSDPLEVTRWRTSTLYALAEERRLYAVVDTAGDRAAYERLLVLGAQARCLYYGTEGARYAAIAPWIASADRALCSWIWDDLAVRDPNWGVFVVSRAGPPAVARQLRRWLSVRLPEGDLMRFRFYDPRVLVPFLSGSTADELRAFFGTAVEAFGLLDDLAQQLVAYARADAPADLPRPAPPPLHDPPGADESSTGIAVSEHVAPYFPLGPSGS